MNHVKVVTLCGSRKFRQEFLKTETNLALKGVAVLRPVFFDHFETIKLTKQQQMELGNAHLRKIELADEVIIMNVNGYIGESTQSEIIYAKKLGKKITYYSDKINQKHLNDLEK